MGNINKEDADELSKIVGKTVCYARAIGKTKWGSDFIEIVFSDGTTMTLMVMNDPHEPWIDVDVREAGIGNVD